MLHPSSTAPPPPPSSSDPLSPPAALSDPSSPPPPYTASPPICLVGAVACSPRVRKQGARGPPSYSALQDPPPAALVAATGPPFRHRHLPRREGCCQPYALPSPSAPSDSSPATLALERRRRERHHCLLPPRARNAGSGSNGANGDGRVEGPQQPSRALLPYARVADSHFGGRELVVTLVPHRSSREGYRWRLRRGRGEGRNRLWATLPPASHPNRGWDLHPCKRCALAARSAASDSITNALRMISESAAVYRGPACFDAVSGKLVGKAGVQFRFTSGRFF
ncbi:Isocitrate lyase family [Musa troglodytarum]|uniref:Isocitrate lyase family n=1 Tax=Musa troglodytarum TaxID=320322 RepID=A0A9E7I0L5_9LILI|nr:Isocitrate lyase family [Musa troglodytarum]